jgi:hypothetical protein
MIKLENKTVKIKMNYSQLINDYLESGLEPVSEKLLFDKLAESDELREDFYTQLKMNKAVAKDSQALVPPLALTNQIFNAVGVSIPTTVAVGLMGRNPGWIAGIGTSLLRYSKDNLAPILSFIIGSTLATALLNFGLKDKQQPQFANNNGTNTVIVQKIDSNKSKKENPIAKATSDIGSNDRKAIPVVINYDKSKEIEYRQIEKIRELERIIEVYKNAEGKEEARKLIATNNKVISNNDNQSANISQSSANNDEEITKLKDKVKLLESVNDRINKTILPANMAYTNDLFLVDFNDNKFERPFPKISSEEEPVVNLRLSGFTNQNTFNSIAGLSNLSIGGLYRTNEFISYGAEIGYEKFNTQNSTTNLMEHTDLLWFTGVASFDTKNYFSFFDVVYPYAQLKLGSSTNGFLGRSQAGLEIAPSKNSSFYIAYDYAYLYYWNSKQWNSTHNNSVIFGISYGF